jgi:7,8-dihydropterin-6-yl-methyl-4-(beta-D-ribofuranosyl)aminobenzene 5'-phosphate synthase
MALRISPVWWPVLAVTSPVLLPWLALKNRKFRLDQTRALELNRERLRQAQPLELPELDFLELTVLVEWMAEPGFLGDPGVSYLLKTDQGSLLYDVGFGAGSPAFSHNVARLGLDLDQIDALAISHLHVDHMGGMPAVRSRTVTLPEAYLPPTPKPCYLPEVSKAAGFTAELVENPRLLAGGIASCGPLARSLFAPFGLMQEQALLARIKGKGLVVITGCGHPTLEVILQMVKKLSPDPIYAFVGGLHMPVTRSRSSPAGIQVQMLVGTGKPVWSRITDEDLTGTIQTIRQAQIGKVYLSAHDSCDHAFVRMQAELSGETVLLSAGKTYSL